LAALGLHILAGLGTFILRAHALWLLTRGVFFLASLALANGRLFALFGFPFLAGLGAFILRAHALWLLTRGVFFLASLALANGRLLAAFGLHILAGLGAFILRAHALWLLTRGVFFLAALALANCRRFLLRLCPFHAGPGPGGFRSMSIGRRRRITTGWCALLRRGAALLVAHSGSLCVSETAAGDQRNGGGRNQKAISHRMSPHVFSLHEPTT